MPPTKKPSGQSDWYEIAMPAHTVTSAMATDRAIARAGRAVSDLAAAAGPIIRLNISSAPTTGTVMLVARAMTSRNTSSIRRAGTPRPGQREHGQAGERVEAEQAGPGRAGEGAVGDGVRGERGPAQHGEEPGHPGDHRHRGGRDPGVDHQRAEHACSASGAGSA